MFSIISHHETIVRQFWIFFHLNSRLNTSILWHEIITICLLIHASITNFHVTTARLCVVFLAICKATSNFNKYSHAAIPLLWAVVHNFVHKSWNLHILCYEIKGNIVFYPNIPYWKNEVNIPFAIKCNTTFSNIFIRK